MLWGATHQRKGSVICQEIIQLKGQKNRERFRDTKRRACGQEKKRN